MKRIYYFDVLKILLVVMVIYHHTAISFCHNGGWFFYAPELVEGVGAAVIGAIGSVNQSFFMSLYFFISAFLTSASIDRKTTKEFIVGRINRLGIPLLLFSFLINPLIVQWLYDTPRWVLGVGPMWFVLTLLIFELLFLAWHRCCSVKHAAKPQCKFPNAGKIILFMVVTGAVAFLVRTFYPIGKSFVGLQFGYFSLYIGMYIAGIAAQRNGWLDRISVRRSLPWFLFAMLVALPVFAWLSAIAKDPADGCGGWNISAVVYAFWEPIMCVGICYFLLAAGKRWFNRPNRFVAALSRETYSAYIIHPVVVIEASIIAINTGLSPIVQLFVALAIAIPCTFAVATLFRRLMNLVKVKI